MKFKGHMQYTGTPIANLATGTLERILPRAEITGYVSGERICTLSQLSEFAFLVLSGRCQETFIAPGEVPRILKTFERGEPIENGVLGQPEQDQVVIIAAEDCTVLRIRHSDLAGLDGDLNGDPATSDSSIIPVAECSAHPTDPRRGRLLTLAVLASNPPADLIGEALARSLHDESGEPVALVCLSPITATSATNRADLDVVLGQPAWQTDLFKNTNGFNLLHIGVPVDSLKDGVIEELTDVLRRRFPYVLVTCAARELPAAVLMEFLTRSTTRYLLPQRTSEDLVYLNQLTENLRTRLNGRGHEQIKTVLCLADDEPIGDFDEQLERAEIPVHSYLHGCGGAGGIFRADIRRMAREISGRLVGLALASGGAKGFAHIGVLQVLEENGIEVDMIAGSSMGAYVGSIWAHGATGPEMEALAREMEGRWAIWSLIDPAFPPRRGFLRGVAVKQRLMRTIGESRFGDLVRPLRVIATNLETLDRVVFANGRVADAVHASIAVPGICVPVIVGEDTFADGGIVDPLPVEALREAGVNRIIAVNTIPTPERMRQALQSRRARARENGQRAKENSSKILPFDQHLNYFARGNILEILMRSFLGVQTRMAEVACLRADVVLRPDIDDNRWVDFRNPEKYIRAGRDVALKHLDEIKALVRGNEVSHEAESIKESLAAVG
jgi:NTE family protein